MKGTRQSTERVLALLGLLVCLCIVTGCGSPKHADAGTARKTLETIFEAWKSGKTKDAFLQGSSIKVIDGRWEGGCKLLEYEIDTGEEARGYDLSYQVTLQLEDGKGRKFQE